MNYLDGNGKKWSIEKGDWVSHQQYDAKLEKSIQRRRTKKNLSTASIIILIFLIGISLLLINKFNT